MPYDRSPSHRSGATPSTRPSRLSSRASSATTSTEIAPWTLVEAEDKHFARVKVLKTLCDAREKAIG